MVRRAYSEYVVVDYLIFLIHKLLGCPMCASYWIFVVSYALFFGSIFGMVLGAISYFLTFFIKKWMYVSI
jgi:uncharacterized membrane protein